MSHNRLARPIALFVLTAAAAIFISIRISQTPAAEPARAPAAKGQAEGEIELLITQALDQKTELELKDVPIREAVQRLSDKTGIPIEVATGTIRFLPYGWQTLVTATIKDRPLGESLTALLRPIGLHFIVEKDRVVIRPTPALERMARRATWPELALLESLLTKSWAQELFDSLKFQFQDSSTDDLQVNRDTLKKMAGSVGAGTAAEVLEHATDRYGWTWYPAEDHIVILSKPKQIERQLERYVKLRYEQSNVKVVLLDLAGQAGVLLKMDPGVLTNLPAGASDRFTLSMENVTVRQALEVVAGETGLGYFIEPDGIRITSTSLTPASTSQGSAAQVEKTAQATVTALRSNAYVGQIMIPNPDGTSYIFFLRENDLPPDVNELRKQRIHEDVERMRARLQTSSQPKD